MQLYFYFFIELKNFFIKDSSLLSIISVSEFTMNAQEVNAYTYSTLESYIPLAFGYLLLTYPISYYSSKLEKQIQ